MKTLLTEALGLSVTVTADPEVFRQATVPRINYSDEATAGSLQIKPHSILFDHGIRDYHLEVQSHPRFHKLFFKNTSGTLPFDLFGAAFWLLSRYEEYLPHKTDSNNRFHYSSSLAYQYDFLDLPLVNVWLAELALLLKEQQPDLQIAARRYNFISSIDIDSAYKYKYKGFVRSMAGFLSDRNYLNLKRRLNILLSRENDPYDCYNFLINNHKQKEVNAIYFFLLGDYGPNDKNHSASDLRFQALIKHLADYSAVGIHPSYGSNNNLRQLKIEVSRLSNITHRIINRSRQHFSMLKFPKTYQDLLQAGIFSDYSMGYTNQNGFRASYCFPYKWYDLDIESSSALTIHSFCISESTLLSQSRLKHRELDELSQPLVSIVKKFGGELISIFHNDNFNEEVCAFYSRFLDAAKE